ncbi:MAG TPA: HD domain-containing protein [Candidatus Limnocylindrales bacterium]|nr:HD domain-containing protein [Candidatus Limnocylindrales bacterium]
MPPVPPLPHAVAGIAVPQDDVSRFSWSWVHRSLPRWLRAHSIRAYLWAAALAERDGLAIDRPILWSASLLHDVGLTSLARNTMCFEVEGAELARRLLERHGMTAQAADRVAIAIILHMQPGVTIADGAEALLLDRSTGLDVRGDGYGLVEDVRDGVMALFPRGDFDRRFLAAIRREAAARPTCQSARLLNGTGLADWMARSPWAAG